MSKTYFLHLSILFAVLLVVACVPTASAFGETKHFDKDQPIKGQIDIVDYYGLPIISTKKADYIITSWTDQCLIDCSGDFIANIYQTDRIFDNLRFIGKDGNEKETKFQLSINSSETYTEPTYADNCSSQLVNGTQQQVCVQYQSGLVTRTREIMIPYNFEPVQRGQYKVHISAKKSKWESVDVIPTAQGQSLTEWAWWDNSFLYKQQVNISNADAITYSNYSMRLNVTYNAHMLAGFDDLRFTESTETTELGYWIDYAKTVNSSSAIVYVYVPTLTASVNTSIYMYYGTATSSTSNITKAFIVGDDFNDAIVNPNWILTTAGSESVVESNGFINVSASGTQQRSTLYYNRNITEYKNYTVFNSMKFVIASGWAGVMIRSTNKGCNGYAYEQQNSGNLRIEEWANIGGTGCGTESYTGSLGSVAHTYTGTAFTNYTNQIIITNLTLKAGTDILSKLDTTFTEGGYIGFVPVDMATSSWYAVDFVYLIGNLTTYPTITYKAEESNIAMTVINSIPLNNSNISSSSITFGCNASAIGNSITSIMLNVTGDVAWTQTITGLSHAQYNATFVNNTLIDGNYNWTCTAYGNNLNGTSSKYALTKDATAPIIAIVYPTTANQSTNVSELNFTASDTHAGNCNMTLASGNRNSSVIGYNQNFTGIQGVQGANTWTLTCNDSFGNINSNSVTFFEDSIYPLIDYSADTLDNGTYNQNFIYINTTWTEINFKNITFRAGSNSFTNSTSSAFYNFTGLTDGFYLYNATICDTVNNCNTTDTRNITLDTINPVVALNSMGNISTLAVPYSQTMTVISTDTNLDSCWYNSTAHPTLNYSITCNTPTDIELIAGYNTITGYANDTANNQNSYSQTIFVNYLIPIMNITTAIPKGESHTVYFNITATSIYQTNATVNYNNTAYAMNLLSNNGTLAQFSKILTAPLVSADTIIPINISYYVNGVAGNNTAQSQTVYNINALSIVAGNACVGNNSLNFIVRDEETDVLVSSEWTYNIYYGLSNTSLVNTAGNISASNNISICINSTVSSSFIIGSGQIGYTATNYDSRIYYFTAGTVITTPPTNTTLYLLNTSGSTDLVAKILNSNLVPQKNISVALLRYYPLTNTWTNVENDISDELGQTIFHVIEKVVNYKFVLSQGGNILYTTDSVKIVCYAVPCQIELTIPSAGDDLFIYYTNRSGVSYTLSYNNDTQVVSMLYNSIDGTPKTIKLLVNQINVSDNPAAICDNVTTGITGLMTCNLNATTGTFFAQAYVNTTTGYNILDRLSISTANFFRTTGVEGLFYAMLFIIALVMVGIWNPTVSIGLTITGFIFLCLIAIISIGWAVLISIIILGGYIIFQLKT